MTKSGLSLHAASGATKKIIDFCHGFCAIVLQVALARGETNRGACAACAKKSPFEPAIFRPFRLVGPRSRSRCRAWRRASITRVSKGATGIAPYHRHGSGGSRSPPPRDRFERGLAWLANSAKTVTIHPLRGLAPPLQPGNLTRRDHPSAGPCHWSHDRWMNMDMNINV